MKKVLIITYYWPPSGGSGVQRWLKFTKYLPEFGVEPIILTVDPDFATYPGLDFSLEKEINSNVLVYRTKARNTLDFYQKIRRKPAPQSGFSGEKKMGFLDKLFRFIRGNVFIPDARIGWNLFAFEKAKQLIEEFGIKTVVTTSPPHSTQLIGLRLKKEFSIHWVADLRDPWTEIYYNKLLYRTNWAIKRDANLEKKCLENADQIIVVSKSIADSFLTKYPAIVNKVNIIANGYDEDDFTNIHENNHQENVISYVGNLGPQYPIEGFLDAFSELLKKDPTWKLKFVGNCHAGVKERIYLLRLESYVVFIPYVSHSEAIQSMMNSSVLLLIIPEIEDNKGILTGKLFEYVATGNPILFIGPTDGDAATILNEYGRSWIVSPSDKIDLERLFSSNEIQLLSNTMENYSRKFLTQKLRKLL